MKGTWSSHALEGALVLAAAAHLALAPFTKVEESFSLHAVRDILALGLDPAVLPQYDHVAFPGAVPRSFIGPLVLSGATWPLLAMGKAAGLWKSGLAVQALVRSVLGALSCASLIFLSRRVRDAFNRPTANTFLLLTITQFHVLFWASRTLPNMFAFPLVQVAVAMLVAPWPRRLRKGKGSKVEVLEAFAILTFVCVVMRLEVVAFLVPLALAALRRGTAKFSDLLKAGTGMAVVALGATVAIDSYFWQQLIWPEGAGILFNVVQGHASDWGTSPWHFYFTRSLPRLVPSLLLGLWAMAVDRRARSIGYPCLAFIALLSFLQHKEWRFFVYAIPALNICSAAGIQSLGGMFSKWHKRLALLLFLGINVAVTTLALYASINNYPGGIALAELAALRNIPDVRTVHIDSHAAMTGASRFLHPHEAPPWYLDLPSASCWTYDKNETLTNFTTFDYLVTGERAPQGFEVVKAIEGFDRFRWHAPTKSDLLPIKPIMKESVWVLKKSS